MPEQDFGATAAYNYIFTSNVLNELRVGVSGNRTWVTFGVSASQIASDLGLTGLSVPKGNAVPDFEISGFQGTGGSNSSSTAGANRTIQLLDNLSWTKGNHTLKFGGDYRRMSGLYTNVYAGLRLGVYNFNGSVTGSPAGDGTNPYIGNEFAAFLLGIPDSTYLDSVIAPDSHGYANGYALFAQDDWRVTPRLTVNAGMRWEYRPMFRDHLLNSTQFLPGLQHSSGWGLCSRCGRDPESKSIRYPEPRVRGIDSSHAHLHRGRGWNSREPALFDKNGLRARASGSRGGLLETIRPLSAAASGDSSPYLSAPSSGRRTPSIVQTRASIFKPSPTARRPSCSPTRSQPTLQSPALSFFNRRVTFITRIRASTSGTSRSSETLDTTLLSN